MTDMLNRYLHSILCLTALCMMAGGAEAQRITTASQVIDCGQVLFRKPVTAHFELTNEGEGTFTIKNVDTSCGCTEVEYPKGIISENKPFVISATYDAKQMGHFEKYIDVYTSGASLPYTLTMKGVVVDEIRDFEGNYPFMIGRLKADASKVMFDDVTKGENPTQEIHVLNASSEMMTPAVLRLPEYLRADISPSSIPPGKPGVLYLTLLTEKLQHPGLVKSNVYLVQKSSDKLTEDKQIAVDAIMLPSFGVVTDQQLLYMPKMKVSDTQIDMGSMEGKKRKKATVTIENLGRTDLEIISCQSFTEGLTLELPDSVVSPGESVKMRVTADMKIMRAVKDKPRILLISNDPRMAKVIIEVNIY